MPVSISRSYRARRVVACAAALALGLAVVQGARTAKAQSFLDQAGDALKSLGESGGLGNGGDTGGTGAGLDQARIADGLREALAVGTERVIDQLGAEGGFLEDPTVHIPLPDDLKRAQSLLESAGFGGYGRAVEERLNRGAEEAMPEAGKVLGAAIRQMTLADAKAILNGPEDAATKFFRRTAGPEIEGRLKPIIERSLEEVGALTALDSMLSQYDTLPFVPDVKGDLVGHATDEAMDGLFHYLAREEAAIRADPAARTTDLLKTVFGS